MKTAQMISPVTVRSQSVRPRPPCGAGLDMPLAEGLRVEQLLAEPVRQSEDAQEGPRAFLEKRKPEFKGR